MSTIATTLDKSLLDSPINDAAVRRPAQILSGQYNHFITYSLGLNILNCLTETAKQAWSHM